MEYEYEYRLYEITFMSPVSRAGDEGTRNTDISEETLIPIHHFLPVLHLNNLQTTDMTTSQPSIPFPKPRHFLHLVSSSMYRSVTSMGLGRKMKEVSNSGTKTRPIHQLQLQFRIHIETHLLGFAFIWINSLSA